MQLLDTVYRNYFHPPAFFCDDDFIRLGTLGAVKARLERLRADAEARLAKATDREQIDILEDDLQDMFDEMRKVKAALTDYSPRKRLDSLVDPNRVPTEPE